MSYSDDPRNYRPLTELIRSFGHATGALGERPDIEHRYQVTEERVPLPPRITHHAYWNHGAATMMVSMKAACPKCFTAQEFCVSKMVAPGPIRGLVTEMDLKATVANLAKELHEMTHSRDWWMNRAHSFEADIRQLPKKAPNSWYWRDTFEMLNGADDL